MPYDAAAFLESLCEPGPPRPGPDDLPDDWRECFEERAAIREFDGRQDRPTAEAEAMRETRDAMVGRGLGGEREQERESRSV